MNVLINGTVDVMLLLTGMFFSRNSCDVSQGGVLSPLLFAVYVNETSIDKSNVTLY